MDNLNELQPNNDGWEQCNYIYQDNSVLEGDTKVYFRDLKDRLIKHIEEADLIFGCVAWLTDGDILDALKRCPNVSIVVQKEDFLRPDMKPYSNWKEWLRAKYDALKCGVDRCRWSLGQLMYVLSVNSWDGTIDPVRCVGNHNSAKSPAFPRMHNKFLVFVKLLPSEEEPDEDQDPEDVGGSIDPYAVWTGSFNFTKNAGHSLENAIYITDKNIVQAYHKEYQQIFAISEPLDWETAWAVPERRIGT